MIWKTETHIGELRPWPDTVVVHRGDEATDYMPVKQASHVITPDDGTDGATGTCRCSYCDGIIDPCDRFCRHCGWRLG